jgi:hypothetical protein
MRIIEAPHDYPAQADIFLGGGISNCPDWQSDVIELLADVPGVALNPRRTGEFTEDIADEQITWEYHALSSVNTVFFWFPKETLCPITLLELGVFTQRPDTRLIVGTHPDYARRFDVIKQLELARPEVKVQDSIQNLVAEYLSIYKKVISNEEKAEKWVRNHIDNLRSDLERTKQIVIDELEPLLGKGTLDDLVKNVEDNYPSVQRGTLKTALKALNGSHYVINADNNLLSLSKVL